MLGRSTVHLCNDAKHFKWFSETQLNYINAVNCLTPDKKHIVSGGCGVDLWCASRIALGLRYTVALAKLGEMDTAYDVFEDTISIIERTMAIPDDEFELGCASPALKGFSLKSNFYWIEYNGKEYRELCMESNNWNNWVVPIDYQNAVNHSWFDSMKSDKKFDLLFERLNQCVIAREKANESNHNDIK